MRVNKAETKGDLLEVMVVKAVRPDIGDEGLPESVRSLRCARRSFPDRRPLDRTSAT
jgi:hypothetical protein